MTIEYRYPTEETAAKVDYVQPDVSRAGLLALNDELVRVIGSRWNTGGTVVMSGRLAVRLQHTILAIAEKTE